MGEVVEHIHLIDTEALGFKRVVACYLIRDVMTAVIDTGYASSLPTVVNSLKMLGVDKLDYIIPTHVHLDHCGGASGLAQLYQEAVVLAHKQAVRHLVNPSRLLESVKAVYGPDILKIFGEVEPIDEARVMAVSDGETLSLGGMELTFIYTPGHAPHQLSIYEPTSNTVFTADAVPAQYPDFGAIIPTTPPPSFNLDEYESSMRRLSHMGAKVFLTPHYGPTEATEARVEKLIAKTRLWVSLFSQVGGDGVARVINIIKKSLEEEAGRPIPQYAESLIHISAMGILKYLGRRQLF
ncbi:MAG: MBL fold metallo-hydrolase [Nitrososphaerota archaeon]